MAAVASEGKLEIDVKWAALNLRVRLVGTAHHRWFRTWIRRHDAATVRYSLRIRFRKLWLRIRGKHSTGPVKKPKWRRTISSVGNQLLLLRNNSSSHKKIVSQEAEKGFVDALRSDRAVMQAIHGVGMASTLIVLVQLTGLLPLFVILAIAATIVFVNRQHSDSSFQGLRFQQLWQQGVSISAISLVPQALRAVLRPYLPQSGFTAMSTITLLLVLLARYQRLPFKAGKQFFGVLPAGILVLWAPIVQLWNCWWSPGNVNFMQVLTGLVAVVSNCFLGYMRNGNILFSTS